MDIEDMKSKITSETVCVIPVHLYGQAIENIAEVVDFVKQQGIYVLEDCAQAHGVYVGETHVGNFGDIAIYSFYPGKNLGAIGDAGCITTNDERLADACRTIAHMGSKEKYHHDMFGVTSRMDNIQARFLNIKLPHLDTCIFQRQEAAELYYKELSSDVLPLRDIQKDTFHVLYVLLPTNVREECQTYMRQRGVETNIHYPVALNRLGCFKYLGKDTTCPNANHFSQTCLSLPMFPGITSEEVLHVCSTLKEFLNQKKH
jgi:dTDP-4-amino-4,6-dideoxygalactose transaminase